MTLLRTLICLFLLVFGGTLFGLEKAPDILITAKAAPVAVQPPHHLVELFCYGAGAIWVFLAGLVGVLVLKELRKPL